MKINKSFVILIIACLVALVFVGYFNMQKLEVADVYDLDTETWLRSHEVWLSCGGNTKNVQVGWSNGEVMDEYYLTSWKEPGIGGTASTGYSEPITLVGGWKPCLRLPCHPVFGKYYWVITIDNGNEKKTLTGDLTKNDGWYDDTLLKLDSGSFVMAQFPGTKSNSYGDCTNAYSLQSEDADGGGEQCNILLQTQPVIFRMKGPYKGVLRAELRVASMCWNDCWTSLREDHLEWVADETELRSGVGKIFVLNNPNPPYQNAFEEGQTMDIQIETNWAGHESEPDGWYVQIFKPDNSVYKDATLYSPTDKRTYTTAAGGFYLGNNLPEFHLNWQIPYGLWDAHGSNTWYIQLQNTFSTESERSLIILYEGAHNDTPGATTMTITNMPADGHWKIGQKPKLHLEADENPSAPAGLDGIHEFQIKAYYIDESEMLADITVMANKKSGFTWYADAELLIEKDIADLTIEARAWSNCLDCVGSSGCYCNLHGGLPGNYDKTVIDITKDGDRGTIFIEVLGDGNPLANAVVTISGGDAHWIYTTDGDGYCSAPDVPDGRYTIEAKHSDYFGSAVATTSIQGGVTRYVTLNLTSWTIYMAIAIAVIMIVVFIAVAYFLPLMIPFKIIIVVVGIVLAVLIFLFMTGYFRIII